MIEVIPAIDLKAGRCVRLYQGDYQQETVYSDDPRLVALDWQEQGAPRLHLVDLDGAAEGRPANLRVITDIVDALTIPVQVGGGIRDIETAQAMLEAGADRVVIGTAAVRNPSLVSQLCQNYGSQRVVVAVDARDGRVAIEGWTQETSMEAEALGKRMAGLGVIRLLYTDISRDGTLTEPNFGANAQLVKSTGLAVQASGGVSSLAHIQRLDEVGVEGVIVGRALYTGDVKLAEAIAAAADPKG